MEGFISDPDVLNIYTSGSAPRFKINSETLDLFCRTLQILEAAENTQDILAMIPCELKTNGEPFSILITPTLKLVVEMRYYSPETRIGQIFITGIVSIN